MGILYCVSCTKERLTVLECRSGYSRKGRHLFSEIWSNQNLLKGRNWCAWRKIDAILEIFLVRSASLSVTQSRRWIEPLRAGRVYSLIQLNAETINRVRCCATPLSRAKLKLWMWHRRPARSHITIRTISCAHTSLKVPPRMNGIRTEKHSSIGTGNSSDHYVDTYLANGRASFYRIAEDPILRSISISMMQRYVACESVLVKTDLYIYIW